MHTVKKIYLIGPMKDIADQHLEPYILESRRLNSLGYEIINPALVCNDKILRWCGSIRNDISGLMNCDLAVLLDGWLKSKDTHLAMFIAKQVGISTIESKRITYGNQLV